MNRRQALLFLLSSIGSALGYSLYRSRKMQKSYSKMPAIFVGHGSPMNAISENDYTQKFKQLSKEFPEPKAILMVSAHWMTRGTWITQMQNPRTIHDFYGFPKELFEVQYPAPGHPELAREIVDHIAKMSLDESEWGLDHGTWSVLKHMYPDAHIPVLQMSLDMTQTPEYHFRLGQELQAFREQGVLIMGSGNVVHNLSQIKWGANAVPYDWALEFDDWVQKKASQRDFKSLMDPASLSQAGKLSIPTPDHYLPLLYVLGASSSKDSLVYDIEGIQNASISMRSFRFG